MNGLYGPDLGIHRGAIEIKNHEQLHDAFIHPNKRAVQSISLDSCSDETLLKLTSAFNCGSLSDLELCLCNFYDFPKSILCLTSLTKLSLRGNEIMILNPGINCFHRLQSLDLSRNRLLSLSPSLLDLHNLRHLDISHNQIESIAFGFETLSHLEHLCCSSNRISILPIGLICKPSFDIEFADNPIVFPPENIMNLGADAAVKLCAAFLKVAVRHHSETEADFSGLQLYFLPRILQPGILHPSDFANIRIVNLSHNMLDTPAATSAIYSNISIFTAVHDLSLEFNILLGLPQFESTTNFSRLSFRRNSIMLLSPELICSQVNLTELFLSHNRISEIPNSLTILKSLKFLELHGNPIHEVHKSFSASMRSGDLDGTIDAFSLTFPNISCPSFPSFYEIVSERDYSLRDIISCVCNVALKTADHLVLPNLGITVTPHVNMFNNQQAYLNLSHNSIRDIEASVFSVACCLTDIDLSHNQLSNVSAFENFTSLIQLKRLNLSNNQLSKYVFHHSNVVHIDLSCNSVEIIPIAAFDSSWSSLIYADFSSNPLCQIGEASSKSDTNRWHEMVFQDQQSFSQNQLPLEDLILNKTGLFASFPLVFARLRALRKLDFSDTYISDLPPLFWRIFEDLTPKTAIFSRCPLSHLSVQIFESFFLHMQVQDTELDARKTILNHGLPQGYRASQILDCCGAAQISLHLECSNFELTDLPKPCLIMTLTIMDISCNRLLNLPAEVFNMINLNTLNISQNDFVVLSENISKLRKLECLDIYDTNITELPYSLALMPLLQSVAWQPAELTRFEIRNKNSTDDNTLPSRVPPASVFFGGWQNAKMFMSHIINSQKAQSLELLDMNLPSLPRELARPEFSECIRELTISDCVMEELPGWISRFTVLTHLDIANNRLSRLPDNFDALTSINHLDLSSNPLTETFPLLSALSKLAFLNLCKTQTRTLHPSISTLVCLKTLALQHTKLCVVPAFISTLSSLQTLLLDGCFITSIAWAVGRCPRLRELQCRSSANVIESPHKFYVSLGSAETLAYLKILCQADACGEMSIMHTNLASFPEEITEIVKLRTLTLLGINIKRIIRSISRLKWLEELNVAQNVLELLPNEIGGLQNLQEFDLSSNLLTTLPDSLAECRHLTTLQLSHNKFQEWPSCIFALISLQTLSFSNNRLEIVPEGVSKLTALKQLFLQNNSILTVSQSVGQLRSLENVDISHNHLSTITVYFGACLHLRRIRRVDLPLLEMKLARMNSLSDGEFIKELRDLYADFVAQNAAKAQAMAGS